LRAGSGRPPWRADGPRFSFVCSQGAIAMTPRTRNHYLAQAAWLAAVLAALGGVFALYVHPTFLVTLVDQVWSCF